MPRRSHLMSLLLLAGGTVLPLSAARSTPTPRPRLVVVIVIDQFRKDYLDRFNDLYRDCGGSYTEAGGFRFLREGGAEFPSARYRHFPLFTGPGHSIVLTGGYPYKTGIVSNNWAAAVPLSERQPLPDGKPDPEAAFKGIYCVQDDEAAGQLVGDGSTPTGTPVSPATLHSTTVGDELKLATGGAAKVVTLALKDRAAILLGGRLTDATIWFDDKSGNWISSKAYCKDGTLPGWVHGINAERGRDIDGAFRKVWKPELTEEQLSRTWLHGHPVEGIRDPNKVGARFPHRIDGGLKEPKDPADFPAFTGDKSKFYKAWTHTPWANQWVLDSARKAVESVHMGGDETPDLLAINLSTNDYAGHMWGPDSPEVADLAVRTDRQLSDFFRYLDGHVPGGLANVTIALTADHGVCPLPEMMQQAGFSSASRIIEEKMEKYASLAMRKRFGKTARPVPGVYDVFATKFVDPYLYLDVPALRKAGIELREARRVAAEGAAEVEHVYAAYPREQVLEGRLGDTDLSGRLSKGFHPKVSGDVVVIPDALSFSEDLRTGGANTTHGSHYAYDTEVPVLLAGFGIRPGTYREPVCPSDIAPTLSSLLRISLPSACDGTALASAMK